MNVSSAISNGTPHQLAGIYKTFVIVQSRNSSRESYIKGYLLSSIRCHFGHFGRPLRCGK